jgi:CheY-like chemotaxis protein
LERPEKTILLVDDEEALRLLITMTLERESYRVVTAADGEEGLAIAKSLKPDLILLDVGLPKINGIEVCRRLRADPETSDLRSVMLSAWVRAEDHAAAFAAGADDYLDKPFRPRDFMDYLTALFAHPSKTRVDRPPGIP